jgi:hypothetical protein
LWKLGNFWVPRKIWQPWARKLNTISFHFLLFYSPQSARMQQTRSRSRVKKMTVFDGDPPGEFLLLGLHIGFGYADSVGAMDFQRRS